MNATTGITVNAICPGWVLTPLVQKQVDARAAADQVDNDEAGAPPAGEKQPSMQFTTPEQLAELALFLCSPGRATTSAAWPGRWTAAGRRSNFRRLVSVPSSARCRSPSR